ncbi:MAG: hypothetical protein IPH48_18150 [bacterium]|nr:hypothetical protein [bacterium]
MKSRFIVAALLLATLATATLVNATLAHATEIIDRRTEQPGTFPVIAAETLRGRSVRLPEQLKGERNLLIVAYEREQQADIDTWLAVLDTLAPQLPDFAYYELPTIGTNYKWMRAVIDGGMKQGIPDRAQRDRTITLYLDVDWFRGQLGTADNDGIAALLVDRQGNIAARWYGRYAAAYGDELRAAVAPAPATQP